MVPQHRCNELGNVVDAYLELLFKGSDELGGKENAEERNSLIKLLFLNNHPYVEDLPHLRLWWSGSVDSGSVDSDLSDTSPESQGDKEAGSILSSAFSFPPSLSEPLKSSSR